MAPAAPQPSSWHRILSRGAKVIAVLIAAGTAIVIVLVSGLMLLLWGCQPPSVDSLAARFPRRQADLQLIIAMSDQDPQISVIDPNWLMTVGGPEFVNGELPPGFSAKRWDEYRRAFRRVGATQGIRRFAPKGDAFIIIKSFGILDDGVSTGYLYCASSGKNQYNPCASIEKSGKHPYSPNAEAYQFIRLTDHWLAYSEGPG